MLLGISTKEKLTKWYNGAATYSHNIVFNIVGDISSTLAEGLLCIAPIIIILFISSSQTGARKIEGMLDMLPISSSTAVHFANSISYTNIMQ